MIFRANGLPLHLAAHPTVANLAMEIQVSMQDRFNTSESMESKSWANDESVNFASV